MLAAVILGVAPPATSDSPRVMLQEGARAAWSLPLSSRDPVVVYRLAVGRITDQLTGKAEAVVQASKATCPAGVRAGCITLARMRAGIPVASFRFDRLMSSAEVTFRTGRHTNHVVWHGAAGMLAAPTCLPGYGLVPSCVNPCPLKLRDAGLAVARYAEAEGTLFGDRLPPQPYSPETMGIVLGGRAALAQWLTATTPGPGCA
jgi:hypothetical protein